MTFPTPSLPASIREALDEYQRRIIRAHSTLRGYDFVAEEDARTALEAHLLALVEREEVATRERDEWRALAMKSGHYVTVELEKHTRVLTGSLAITAELIALSKCDAIVECCANLARQFRAEYKRAYPALTPPEDTTPHE